jgi:hypothetical protein
MSKTGRITKYSIRLLIKSVFVIPIVLGVTAFVPRASAAEVVRLEIVLAEASRSSSGLSIDKRLIFAKAGLLRTSYNKFTYIRRHPLTLGKGKPTKLTLGGKVSVVIEFKGFVGSKRDRIQYYLETYWGKKRQAGVYYSVSRGGAPAITGIDQPGTGRAYVIIVRALK